MDFENQGEKDQYKCICRTLPDKTSPAEKFYFFDCLWSQFYDVSVASSRVKHHLSKTSGTTPTDNRLQKARQPAAHFTDESGQEDSLCPIKAVQWPTEIPFL